MLVWAGDAKALSSGNEMYQVCTQPDLVNKEGCRGFVIGAFQMSGAMQTKLIGCWKGVTGRQAEDIFVNYLRDNPQTRHEPAVLLLLRAMNKAIPCF